MQPSRSKQARRRRVALVCFLLTNLAVLGALALFRGDADPTSPWERHGDAEPPAAPPAPSPAGTADAATVEVPDAAARETIGPAIDPRHPLLPLLSLRPYRDLAEGQLLSLHIPALFSPLELRVRHAGLDARAARAFGDGAAADSSRLVLAQLGVAACGSLSREDESWVRSIVAENGGGWKHGRPSLGALAGIHALRLAGAFDALESVADSWIDLDFPSADFDEALGLLLESVTIPGSRLPGTRLLAILRTRPDSPRVHAACSRLLARSGDHVAIAAMIERAASGDDAALSGVAFLADAWFGPILRAWFDASRKAPSVAQSTAAIRALLRIADDESLAFLESILAPGGAYRDRWLEALDRSDPDPLALPAIHHLRAELGDDFLASLADRSAGVPPRSIPRADRIRLGESLRSVCDELAPESLAWSRSIATLARFATDHDLPYLAQHRPLAREPELRFRIDVALGVATDRDHDDYVAGRR